jgi:predicted PurR-regulated permease PerM
LSDLFLVVLLIGLLALIIIPLIGQGTDFLRNVPDVTNRILNNPTVSGLNETYHFSDSVRQSSNQIGALIVGGGLSLLTVAGGAVTIFLSVSSIFLLTVLLQSEGRKLWRGFLGLLNEEYSKIAERIGLHIMQAVGGFVTGNLLISLIAGVVTAVTLWILGVPYVFPLAVLVAFLDLIPLVGTAIATILVALVALLKGLLAAVIVVVVLLIYQFVEGHFIQPVVYSRSIALSALVIVIASLLGAEIAGIIGILLAIPLAAIAQIVILEIYDLYKANTTDMRAS